MEPEIVYWNEEIETLPGDGIREIQWERIRNRLSYLKDKSRFYSRKLGDVDPKSNAFQDLDDFRKLVPFTTKKELQEERERSQDPYSGLLCVPPTEIIHLIRTAGTTGVPTIYGLTREDLHTIGELSARMWYQLGARKGHTVAIGTFGSWNPFSTTLLEGLRTAGIKRYHFSMPAPGEEVFPVEILSRWMDIEGIYLSSRPLYQVTEKYGMKLKEFLPKLQYLFMAGQHVTSSFRKGIEAIWSGKLFDAYPMTDACLPSANCTKQVEAFHFPQDAFFVEIIDPETGQDLTGSGKVGEIVVSSLVLEGTPLLRFRSGDMGIIVSEPCPCGRTGARLGISERMAHAVLVGDRTIFSSDVEEVLYGIPDFFLKQYHLVKRKVQPQERLILRVEQPSGTSSEERLKEELASRIREDMGVDSEIKFLSKGDEKFVAMYKFLKVVTE